MFPFVISNQFYPINSTLSSINPIKYQILLIICCFIQ